MKELIRDDRGYFSVIFMFFLSLLVTIIISSVEGPRDKHGADVDLQSAVEQAAYAAANGVDKISQANGSPFIDPFKAHDIFKNYLAKNLLLDMFTLEPTERSGIRSTPEYQLLVVNGDNPYVLKGYVFSNTAPEGFVDIEIPVTLGISQDLGIVLSGTGDLMTTVKSPSCVAIVKAELKEVVAANSERETVRWSVGRLVK